MFFSLTNLFQNLSNVTAPEAMPSETLIPVGGGVGSLNAEKSFLRKNNQKRLNTPLARLMTSFSSITWRAFSSTILQDSSTAAECSSNLFESSSTAAECSSAIFESSSTATQSCLLVEYQIITNNTSKNIALRSLTTLTVTITAQGDSINNKNH